MRQTVHLFIGDDLALMGEAVANHSNLYGTGKQNENIRFVCCKNIDNVLSLRTLQSATDKVQITNDSHAIWYFEDLYGQLITIENGDDNRLFLTIYVQLYKIEDIATCCQLQKWVAQCSKPFDINVIGISHDLAFLYCATEGERKQLIEEHHEYKAKTLESLKRLIALKRQINSNDGNLFGGNTSVLRLFLLQNCNEEGRGLNLDKNTLIKILGEYSLLVTECDHVIFPLSITPSEDISLFGLSELWFNPSLFEEKLLKYTFLYLIEKEKVNETAISNPLQFLDEVRDLIENNKIRLREFVDKAIGNNSSGESRVEQGKQNVIADFKRELEQFGSRVEEVIGNLKYSLPEKRAFIALLIREDDPLFDDEILVQTLPTLDDCMSEAVDLYVETNNKMSSSVLSGPQKEGKLYNPNDELKARLADLRKSYAFIRKARKRLEEIEKSLVLEHESKKLFTEQGFTYGNSTYRLQHDVVEKPLEADYHPQVAPSIEGVDLRSGFSPIRNQGPIGSCSAFSISSIFEFVINEADPGSSKIVLSPRFLYYNVCDKNDDGTPVDKGSSFYDTIQILGKSGICTERLCAYSGNFSEKPSPEAYEEAKSRLVTEAKNVKLCDIKSALTEGYPVAISLKIFDSFGKGRKGFVFRPSVNELQGSDYGYHAMVICGYSEQDKVYIVRNSWGTDFGKDGYCYIPFSYIEDANLCRQAVVITGVSCAEIAPCEIFADQPAELEGNDKDIEYSVLRIKIEEEEVSAREQQRQYKELYREYMTLLVDLGNTTKRKQITNYAVATHSQHLHDKQLAESVVTANEDVSSPNKFYIVGAVFCAVLGGVLFWIKPSKMEALPVSLFVIAIVLLILSFIKKTDKKNVETIVSHPAHDIKAEVELKYIMAGMLIDKVNQLRNNYVNKHSCLVSFVRNLQQWYGEVNEELQKSHEQLKAPFISLFNEAMFNRFFDNNKERWTNFHLYDDFRYYSPTEQSIIKLKNRIFDKLGKRIDDPCQNFSMCNYLIQSEQYPYLPQINEVCVEKWLNKLSQMSLPFAQIVGGKASKNVHSCILGNGEQDALDKLVALNSTFQQTSGKVSSPFKLICVQVQEVDLNELKIVE